MRLKAELHQPRTRSCTELRPAARERPTRVFAQTRVRPDSVRGSTHRQCHLKSGHSQPSSMTTSTRRTPEVVVEAERTLVGAAQQVPQYASMPSRRPARVEPDGTGLSARHRP